MHDLFIRQSDKGYQWQVCKGCAEDYKIIWVEYSEIEAKDMLNCILRLGYKCRKRKK